MVHTVPPHFDIGELAPVWIEQVVEAGSRAFQCQPSEKHDQEKTVGEQRSEVNDLASAFYSFPDAEVDDNVGAEHTDCDQGHDSAKFIDTVCLVQHLFREEVFVEEARGLHQLFIFLR